MAIPAYAEMVTPHYAEWLVEKDEAFRGTVMMAMKEVAFQVYQSDDQSWGWEKRRQIAENIVRSPDEAQRLLPLFSASVMQDPALRPQAFDITAGTKPMLDRIQPWKMDSAKMHTAILRVWDIAANVQPEPTVPTEPTP